MRSKVSPTPRGIGLGRKGGLAGQLSRQLGDSQVLAVLYLSGAMAYGILSFRNFSVGEVVTTVLLFSALPLGLILFSASPRRAGSVTNRWSSVVISGFIAPLMFFVQFSGLRMWEGYFSNFANHRLERGEPGFHPDSVFHVAIIQGILNNAYPTTGQHLEPWVRYHALSHYVDAVSLRLLSIDPWESYALLFFAKGIALTLGVIYFALRVAEPHFTRFFWAVLAIVYPAFTATWHVIGSHGQWLPMVLFTLSAYHVFVVAMKDRRTWRDYALLTLLIVALSLGKISLGFGLAVLVGFWLFLRKPFDWRLAVTGLGWLVFFGLYGGFFFGFRTGVISQPGVSLGNLEISGAEIFAICLLGVVSGLVARGAEHTYARSYAVAVGISLGFVTLLVIVVTENSSDGFYFFSGLFSVTLFLSVPLIAGILLRQPISGVARRRTEKSELRILALAGSLLFASSPVVATAHVSLYSSLSAIWSTASAMKDHSYFWFNESAAHTESRSVWHGLRGIQLPKDKPEEAPYASRLRDSLRKYVTANELSNQAPLLHLTSEQFVVIGDKFSAPNDWSIGLAVTAVTGMPLVFGVAEPNFQYYGFSDYDSNAQVRKENETFIDDLCSFNRPVITVVDVSALEFALFCEVTS